MLLASVSLSLLSGPSSLSSFRDVRSGDVGLSRGVRVTEALLTFLHGLSFQLSNLIFLIFKLAASFAYSNLLLNPSTMSFIIYLFILLSIFYCIYFSAPGFLCHPFL